MGALTLIKTIGQVATTIGANAIVTEAITNIAPHAMKHSGTLVRWSSRISAFLIGSMVADATCKHLESYISSFETIKSKMDQAVEEKEEAENV